MCHAVYTVHRCGCPGVIKRYFCALPLPCCKEKIDHPARQCLETSCERHARMDRHRIGPDPEEDIHPAYRSTPTRPQTRINSQCMSGTMRNIAQDLHDIDMPAAVPYYVESPRRRWEREQASRSPLYADAGVSQHRSPRGTTRSGLRDNAGHGTSQGYTYAEANNISSFQRRGDYQRTGEAYDRQKERMRVKEGARDGRYLRDRVESRGGKRSGKGRCVVM